LGDTLGRSKQRGRNDVKSGVSGNVFKVFLQFTMPAYGNSLPANTAGRAKPWLAVAKGSWRRSVGIDQDPSGMEARMGFRLLRVGVGPDGNLAPVKADAEASAGLGILRGVDRSRRRR